MWRSGVAVARWSSHVAGKSQSLKIFRFFLVTLVDLKGVARGGGGMPPIVDALDFLTEKWLCWDPEN